MTTSQCYLCGKVEDAAPHLYFDCTVVREARKIVSTETRAKMENNPLHITLLHNYKNDSLSIIITLAFKWCVWHLRTTYFATLASPDAENKAISRVVNFTL